MNDAVARGHEVTLFHRGIHNPDLYPELEHVLADRDGELSALAGRTFDAVVDTSGYFPRVVRAAAEFLADSVGHYTFVSTLSVYADATTPGQDESAPLATIEDTGIEKVTGETYGPLKALSEEAAEAAMPGRVLVVRPGLIVGPHDVSDRFTYWPWRIARGGDVLAPAPADAKVEFTDARDLAALIVSAAEADTTGVMNTSGPTPEKTTMGELLETCREVANSDARFVWKDEEWLAARDIGVWMDMPLFTGTEAPGLATHDTSRAVAAGLRFRPMADTVRDTLEWSRLLPPDHQWRAGLSAERERAALTQA